MGSSRVGFIITILVFCFSAHADTTGTAQPVDSTGTYAALPVTSTDSFSSTDTGTVSKPLAVSETSAVSDTATATDTAAINEALPIGAAVYQMGEERWSVQQFVFLALLVALGTALWLVYARFEPDIWRNIKEWEGTRIRSLRIKDLEIIQDSSLVRAIIVALRGVRFLMGLLVLYVIATQILAGVDAPFTVVPTLRGILLSIAAIALFRVINATFPRLYNKLKSWEGRVIVPLRFRGYEIVSAPDATEFTVDIFRGVRLIFVLGFLTWLVGFLFSLFALPEHWSGAGITHEIILKALSAVFLMAVYSMFHKYIPRVAAKVDSWEGDPIRGISVRGYELFSQETVTDGIIYLIRLIHMATVFLFLYVLTVHFAVLFPKTTEQAVRGIAVGIFWAGGFTLMMILVAKSLWGIQQVLEVRLQQWRGTLIQSIRVKRAELFAPERLAELINGTVKITTRLTIVVAFYFYITSVFSLFTFSAAWAETLVSYVLTPAGVALKAIVNYLPNLFTIAVIITVAYYGVKLIRWFFQEVEKGTIPLPGFFPDWATPTYKIVRFLVIAFVLIVVFPYLPGSNSPAFQGVSIFLGVLFSLGSSSAIANVVSGIVLTYMRALEPGDRVQIGETTGDVLEKTLLVTRIRTSKNVEIAIPNAMVLGDHIINYSASARQGNGLLLHTTVTIGYDIPWRHVHELLIKAADMTEDVMREPAPFVHQTGLNDFYPAYELNVYTDKPGSMAHIYSDLHANIQDVFNEANVEILSPHYSAVRDGNEVTTPPDYRPADYTPSVFRLLGIGGFGNKPVRHKPDENRHEPNEGETRE